MWYMATDQPSTHVVYGNRSTLYPCGIWQQINPLPMWYMDQPSTHVVYGNRWIKGGDPSHPRMLITGC
jgi:hypothetical protein